jgi:hypothetical protein
MFTEFLRYKEIVHVKQFLLRGQDSVYVVGCSSMVETEHVCSKVLLYLLQGTG